MTGVMQSPPRPPLAAGPGLRWRFVNPALDEIRSRIGSSIRSLVAGSAEPRPEPSGPGLFGPNSATWEVHADAAMLVGGIRSLLLQTLHPPTMAGVAEHSSYKSDPLGRLQRTSQFLGTTTFGSIAETEQAIATVRKIHERVEGTAPDGTGYRANDPHLLAWVHATEVHSFLDAKRRFGRGTISDETADRYVAEMAVIGEKLGVIDAPRSTTELDATLRSYEPELRLTSQSREALWFIAFAPLAIPLRAPYTVLLGGAVSSLPRWARRKLWIPRLPVTERMAVRPAAQALIRLLDWGLTSPQ
jgi:uncharacterized protein (DUF2236 family)